MPSAATLPAAVSTASNVNALRSQHDRLEELQTSITAALRVNKHLNEEVEHALREIGQAEQERDAWQQHARNLAQRLTQARRQLSRQLASSLASASPTSNNTASHVAWDGEAEEEMALLLHLPPYDILQPGSSSEDTTSHTMPRNHHQQQQSGARLGSSLPAHNNAAQQPAPSQPSETFLSGIEGSGRQQQQQQRQPLQLSTAQAALVAGLLERGRALGWVVEPGDVELHEVLGEGEFGVTRRGMWRATEVAVKSVRVAEDTDLTMFMREVEAMSMLRHPHIVPFLGAALHPPSTFWILLEYMPKGTLSKWLYPHGMGQGSMQGPPLLERIDMAWQVAQGMVALESSRPPVLHRDLKPSNVFLDAAGQARVADFGLARRMLPGTASTLTGETGTYLYMAPEVMRHESYSLKADVWSWGVLLAEVLSGVPPYAHTYLSPAQVACAVADERLAPDIPSTVDADLQVLARAACDFDPCNRPSFAYLASELGAVVARMRKQAAPSLGSTAARLHSSLASGWGSVLARMYPRLPPHLPPQAQRQQQQPQQLHKHITN